MHLARLLARATLTVALIAATPSFATDTLHTTGWLAPTPPDNFQLHRTGHAALTPGGVGGFTGTWNGASIFFWCFDLDQYFNFGHNYTEYVEETYTGPQLDEVARLFDVAYFDVIAAPNRDNSAAFQVALWNIEYDTDADVRSGTFYADHGSPLPPTGHPGAALDLANTWLGDLHKPGVSGAGWTITRLVSREHQDFIIGTYEPSKDVPEPATWALLLLATAVMAGARKVKTIRGM